jgi:hypothetical protein
MRFVTQKEDNNLTMNEIHLNVLDEPNVLGSDEIELSQYNEIQIPHDGYKIRVMSNGNFLV